MQHSVRLAGCEDLLGVQRLYKELRPRDPELSPARATTVWKELLDNPNTRVIVAERNGLLASTCMLAAIPNFASGGQETRDPPEATDAQTGCTGADHAAFPDGKGVGIPHGAVFSR